MTSWTEHDFQQAEKTIRQRSADVWARRTSKTFAEFVESTVRLDPDYEVTGGAYSLEENPFWRQVLNDVVDPEVYKISVMKSTRVGGTLTLIAAMLGLSQFSPAPSMVVCPDEISTKEIRDRVYSTGEKSDTYLMQVPRERDRNMREIDLSAMRCYLAWAGSAQRLRGRACRYVFRSEVDVYPPKTAKGGDPLKASEQRAGRFYFSTVYSESTPDGDPSNIDTLYRQGNQCIWMCPCPHCGMYQEMRFFTFKAGPHEGCGGIEGYKNSDGNLLSVDDARVNAFYRCINRCRIENYEKNRMVLDGVWCPKGQSVSDSGQLTGDPERSRRHSSYHLWKAHIPSVSFADIAEMYVTAVNDSTLKDYWQNDLGRKYKVGRPVPEWNKLGRKLECNYKRGLVPKDAWFLTGAADVQDEGVWWGVYGWGHAGTCWLVDWGYIERIKGAEQYQQDDLDLIDDSELVSSLASDISQLTNILINRYFQVEGGLQNPLGKKQLRCRMVCIDTNYRTRHVQEFVRFHEPYADVKIDRVRTVRGDHAVKRSERFRMTNVERPQRGTGPEYRGGMQLFGISVDHYKDELSQRCALEPGVDGGVRLYSGIVKDGKKYLQHMTNETYAEKILANGRKQKVWTVQHEHVGNHEWDVACYAFAGAEMLLNRHELTWDSTTWLSSKDDEGVTLEMESYALRESMYAES